ncbi:MAG TPA: MFS transporter [Dehalococcoidia bacterium]|nr:MFS transporter [Dehalococcoidia bacterium]
MAGVAVDKERTEQRPGLLAYPGSNWVRSTFESLGIRAYRVLWIGTVFSFIGFMMSMTAQNLVAFDLTGNNRAVGLVAFGQGVAMLALTPFGGAIADRVSKRFLLLVCQGTIGLVMVGTGALIAGDAITVFWLAAGSFVIGVMFSFLGPTRTAYIGEIVDEERRGNALALTQVGMNATRVFGPFVAGGLMAWGAVGSAGTYFIMGGLFALVVVTLAQLPPSRGTRRHSSMLRDIRLGMAHVRENPRLLQVVVGFIAVTVVGFPYMVVMPGFTQDVLGTGKAGFGIMVGVSAIGGLAASLVVAGLADSSKAPALQLLASLLLGISLILTGLAPNFALALLTMVLAGAGGSAFQTLNNAVALKEAHADYFGRVMSLMMMAWSFNGLIGLPIGYLADEAGERTVLLAMGAGVCAIVALLALWRLRLPQSAADVAAKVERA